jgi:glycosyltransferase involved in cell wall biosynthesis
MTKVIISTPVWSLNGINVFSEALARGIRDRGYDARILITGVTYREKKPLPLPRTIPITQLSIPRGATWSARQRSLRQYLEQYSPCVYLPNHDFNHSCITPSLRVDVGVIGIVHSDDEQHYDHFRRLGATWNAVVAVSSRIRERLAALGSADPARIHTIPYGVNAVAHHSIRNDRPVRIIYTGRLEENQKRVSDLIRIAATLRERGVSFEMSIVGDGPARDAISKAIDASDLSHRVRLVATVEPARVAELCAEQDVFLLPSVYEGMPISLLEAMGQGCIPVVRKSESGIPELIADGQNGMIVADGNIEFYADCIGRIASDRVLRRLMSENAWKTIATGGFDLNTMIDRYAALIETVASESLAGNFVRKSPADPSPRISLRDIIAAPLWSMRPSIRAQQTLPD